MADIIAAFQAALSIGKEKEEKPGEGQEDKPVKEHKSELVIRLERVALKLSRVIRKEERKVLNAQKAAIAEAKRLKEEADLLTIEAAAKLPEKPAEPSKKPELAKIQEEIKVPIPLASSIKKVLKKPNA